MAWIITRDLNSERYGDERSCKGVGVNPDYVERIPTNKFILKDDDNISYYHGYCDDEDDGLFDPLDWAMAYAGCTSILYKSGPGGVYEII